MLELNIKYHPAQNEIFYGNNAKIKVIPKGRRFGLTSGYAKFVIENLCEGTSPILWVDTVQGNIDKYFQRYFVPVLSQLPRNQWHWNAQSKEFKLFNQYICDFRSAERPEFIEGFAYRLMLLNEAGIILRKRALWENTLKAMTIDYNPDVYIGGTPKGGGLFEELAIAAKSNPQGWAKTFTTYDNPYLEKAMIDKTVSEMPEIVAKQEIFGEFISDAGAVFKRITESLGAVPIPNWLPKRKYYMGVDLAKHVDYTVIIIMDDLGHMVYFNRFNKLDWEYQQAVIVKAAGLFNASVLIDSTGVGDAVFDALKSKGLDVDGYKFTNESKKKLIERLMLAFEMQEIKIFDNEILKDELRLFGYEISKTGVLRYSAPEGFHDDCVMALALALWIKENMPEKSGFAISQKKVY